MILSVHSSTHRERRVEKDNSLVPCVSLHKGSEREKGRTFLSLWQSIPWNAAASHAVRREVKAKTGGCRVYREVPWSLKRLLSWCSVLSSVISFPTNSDFSCCCSKATLKGTYIPTTSLSLSAAPVRVTFSFHLSLTHNVPTLPLSSTIWPGKFICLRYIIWKRPLTGTLWDACNLCFSSYNKPSLSTSSPPPLSLHSPLTLFVLKLSLEWPVYQQPPYTSVSALSAQFTSHLNAFLNSMCHW